VTIELGVLISVLGLVIAFQGFQLNKTKAIKSDGQENAELKAELGYIRKGVDDIRIDIKTSEKQMQQHGERITRLEESSKQAHKRIDKLEKGDA
jgi:peptidoglycan hydrolase CwlO-like protein